jgi:hypothetical protein
MRQTLLIRRWRHGGKDRFEFFSGMRVTSDRTGGKQIPMYQKFRDGPDVFKKSDFPWEIRYFDSPASKPGTSSAPKPQKQNDLSIGTGRFVS